MIENTVYERVTNRLREAIFRTQRGELKWNMQTPGVDNLKRLAVLIGEVGEVGQAVQERYAGTDRDNLIHELEDVAACALGWLLAIECEEE